MTRRFFFFILAMVALTITGMGSAFAQTSFSITMSIEGLEPGTMDSLENAGLVTIDIQSGELTFGDEPLMQAGEITSPGAWVDQYIEITSDETSLFASAFIEAAMGAGASYKLASGWFRDDVMGGHPFDEVVE